MDRKKIIWLRVALAVAGLTIWAVISQSGSLSLERLMLLIRTANPGWLALAFAAMLGFIVFEGEAVIVIAKSLGYKRSHRRGFVYSAADIYFSAITPSASGGQPASAYFMIKDGIPGPTTTVVLILNLVMYTLATLTIGVGAIIVSPGVFLHFSLLSKLLIIVGFVVIAFLALLFYMLLRKGEILYKLGSKLFRFLAKIHLMKHIDRRLEKLRKSIDEYKETALLTRGQKGMMIKAYVLNVLQKLSQTLVTVFMFLATGGEAAKTADMWATQSLVTTGSNCVPIPGAMGVADYLMIDGFQGLVERNYAYELEMLSRGLSFYVCIIISCITIIIAYFLLKRRKRQ